MALWYYLENYQAIEDGDSDGDGRIDLDEFKNEILSSLVWFLRVSGQYGSVGHWIFQRRSSFLKIELGAIHKLRKAERGGRGVQEILTIPYEGEGGTWGIPYVRLHFFTILPIFGNLSTI